MIIVITMCSCGFPASFLNGRLPVQHDGEGRLRAWARAGRGSDEESIAIRGDVPSRHTGGTLNKARGQPEAV